MELSCPTTKVLAMVYTSGRQLAAGGSDNLIRLWDLGTGDVQYRLEGHTGSVAALAYDPKARLLVSGSFDTTIRLWNLNRFTHDETAQRRKTDR